MARTWTPDQVVQLAPDDSSVQAARGLAKASKWSALGRSDRALWGEIKGSGSKPYQTRVNLEEPAFKCSCPSRKFPCKHALALMMILTDSPGRVPTTDAPGWVSEWLADREKRHVQKAAKAEQKTEEAKDPQAQARRVAQREAKIKAGLQELSVWLGDLLRQGLAAVRSQPTSFWDTAAARLVDAQAPGLARQIRLLAEAANSSDNWQERLLAGIGRVHLLIQAYQRLDLLAEDVRADVRTAVGWTTAKDDLLKLPTVRDTWSVLGQIVEEEERLKARKSWLRGVQTGRFAMILEYAAGNEAFDAGLTAGIRFEADLVYYPGGRPLRALVRERFGSASQATAIAGLELISQAEAEYALAMASCPWLEQLPLSLSGVVPVCRQGQAGGGRWFLRDREGREMPLHSRRGCGWHLLAVSGGLPIAVFGEWDGEVLLPMSAASEGRFFAISHGEERLPMVRTA